MPRTATNKAASILAFFRTAEIGVAMLVLDLCKDAVKDRRSRGTAIREAQVKAYKKRTKAAPSATAAVDAATQSAVQVGQPKKRRRRRKKGAQAQDQAQEQPSLGEVDEYLQGPELEEVLS